MLSSFFYLESNKTRVRYVIDTKRSNNYIVVWRELSFPPCFLVGWLFDTSMNSLYCTARKFGSVLYCVVFGKKKTSQFTTTTKKVDLNDVCVFVFCLPLFFLSLSSVASLIASFSSEEDEPTHPSSS